ncbi:MAG: orotate phosphoribosyltransferase [Chloroflexi bacterium]|nr:orotate phosphoribosyltransferase [Chloroflexota bacterium]
MTTIKPSVELAARLEIAKRTEALFRSSGALRDGHFLLKSGRHSDAYLEKFSVLSDPGTTSELCAFWAARYRDARGVPSVDIVAGPTTGGVILSFETGRQLGSPAIFAEEVTLADGTVRREFRRGFRIEAGQRVLLVDDILTTGGSLVAMLPAIEAMGGEIVECAVLVDRSGGRTTVTSPTTGRVYPVRALWAMDLETYEAGPANCPMCAAGTPLSAPGSTGASAHQGSAAGAPAVAPGGMANAIRLEDPSTAGDTN